MAEIDVPLTEEGNLLVGPARIGITRSAGTTDDPLTEIRLGFRNPIVAVDLHANVLVPLLLRIFGENWFQHGTLALSFLNSTRHGKPVQAVAERVAGESAMVKVWVRQADDPSIVVCEGMASLSDDTQGEWHTHDLQLADSAALRIFHNVVPGQIIGDAKLTVTTANQQDWLADGSISEPLPWYDSESPWGGPIAAPSTVSGLMLQLIESSDAMPWEQWKYGSNGMAGAVEIRFNQGPVLLDQLYRIQAVAVGAGETPEEEYGWWDATIEDADGELIATVRQMQRYNKLGSGFYPELAPELLPDGR